MMTFIRHYLYKLLYDETLYATALSVTLHANSFKELSLSKKLISNYEKDIYKFGNPSSEMIENLKYLKSLWVIRFKHWKMQD